MKIMTLGKIRNASTGMLVFQSDATYGKYLQQVCKDNEQTKYLNITIGATYLVDLELYRAVQIAFLNALEHVPSKQSSKVLPKEHKESTVTAAEIIKKIKESKRSWLGVSNTTNSQYLHGNVEGKCYQIRESDHGKDGSQGYSLTLHKVEPAKKYWLTNKTPKGKVTYSTQWRTTVVDDEGNKKNYTTAYLRSLED